jgi:hypothetical protein
MTSTPIPDQASAPGAATGPRTPDGKARSSQNSTKIGLYTARDFIRPGEEDEYLLGFNNLISELSPQTPLEHVFATEIMSANWRLRRCRIIEADFALLPEPDEKAQRSVDRARSQSHSILRRSLAELRKLQTERAIRAHAEIPVAGLAETRKILHAMKSAPKDGASRPGQDARQVPSGPDTSFCKPAKATPIRAHNTPRNAPCPCRSGRKYKKCCGNPATQPVKIAA